MLFRRDLFLLISLVLLLSACQQAAWKAGANADDLKRDEDACRAQSSDDEAIKRCLGDKGWTLMDFGAAGDDEMAPVDEPAPAAAASSTSPQAERAPLTAPAQASATPALIAPPKSADPLQRQSVQTWWKAGAHAADFDKDANACLGELGEQHAPDYAQHRFTRAMVSCLRARGWISGRDPVYTPLR